MKFNTLFENARIKLTLWYVVIIAAISISFSTILYRDVTWELERGFQRAQTHVMGLPVARDRIKSLLQVELAASKKQVLFRLLVINGVIISAASIVGYILAGKTLKPIEDILESQKRFVADASHELRTPLTSLKTEVEVALRGKKIKTKEVRNLLKSNLAEIDRMKNLTDYLLSLSRLDTKQKDLEMEKVDLTEAANQAIEKNKAQAKEKNIKIIKKINNVVAYGSPQSLVELISILINNAIKYSANGNSIIVSIGKTRANILIKVTDHGEGINNKDIPHIFDRFYRADIARSKKEVDGYGLGLSIAKSIVSAHNGRIKVKSVLEKGTTFSVFLPV